MKRISLFVFVFLFFADKIAAQIDNNLAILLEKAVIEYYDTLSTASHHDYHMKKYIRGELYDTNIYLYADYVGANFVDLRFFLINLQVPDRIPPKAFYREKHNFQFLERSASPKTVSWTYCRSPKIPNNRELIVLEISGIDLHSDTLSIKLTLCYLSKNKKLSGDRYRIKYGFAVAEGVIFDYVYSNTTQDWECVNRFSWGV